MIGKTIEKVDLGMSYHPDGFTGKPDTLKITFTDGTFSLFETKLDNHPNSLEPISIIIEETW